MVAEVESRRRMRRINRLRNLNVGIILTTLIALVLGGLFASPAGAAGRQAVSDGGVSVTVAADNGGILGPGADLGVTVTVTNTESAPFAPGTLNLWVDPTPLTSRTDLASWLAATGEPTDATAIGVVTTNVIEAESTSSYRITVPAAGTAIAGHTTDASFGIGSTLTVGTDALSSGRGELVWNPGVTTSATNVAVVMPITVPPSANGVISAANLATYTAPNGILIRQLDGLELHPQVAIGIDPMIIASIRALGNAAPATARAWLQRLANSQNDTFPLSYGDADLAGQIQTGLKAPLEPSSFTFALDPANFKTPVPQVGEPALPPVEPGATPTPTPSAGATGPVLPTTKQLLSWQYTMNSVAWPGDNTVTAADVTTLASAGLKTTIVSSSNTNATSLKSTPNAPVPVGNDMAISSDAGISAAIQAAASASSDEAWNLAMSNANAQLELLAQEQSSGPRTILVALDREWPSSATQLQRTLAGVSSSPWSAPATFGAAIGATPTTGFALKDSAEPKSRIDTISQLLAAETSLDSFATVLDTPDTLIGQTRADLLALLGVGWLNPKNDWPAAVTTSLNASHQTLTAVSILSTDNVNLVGTQGSIPFTVSNLLPNNSVTVVVSASPSNSRLEIDGTTTKMVQPDSRATVLVPVKAELGNGRVTLTLQLYSQTGVPIGTATSVPVEVHADWEGIGALIVGSLLVLLFGFGIVRNILRRRSGTTDETADDESADDKTSGDTIHDNEIVGDQAAPSPTVGDAESGNTHTPATGVEGSRG
jgi:Family of unknown function (DUF6049)